MGVLGGKTALMYKLKIVNMLDEISSFLDVVQFHASGLCHLTSFFCYTTGLAGYISRFASISVSA